MTTVVHCPSRIACVARATNISKALPPAKVESVQRGTTPRWSASWVAEKRPTPVVAMPSTSARVSPASASARVTAWVCRPRIERPVTPRSDSAAPTMATRWSWAPPALSVHRCTGDPHSQALQQPRSDRKPEEWGAITTHPARPPHRRRGTRDPASSPTRRRRTDRVTPSSTEVTGAVAAHRLAGEDQAAEAELQLAHDRTAARASPAPSRRAARRTPGRPRPGRSAALGERRRCRSAAGASPRSRRRTRPCRAGSMRALQRRHRVADSDAHARSTRRR